MKRLVQTGLLLISLSLACQAATRKVTELKLWETAKTQSELPSETGWSHAILPHDWSIVGPYNKKYEMETIKGWMGDTLLHNVTGMTGGLPCVGVTWYRTKINLKAKDPNKVYYLVFDGAMSEPDVYINNEEALYWPSGYNAFWEDITTYLKEGENTILVRLSNKEKSASWYTGAGLYRPVKLIEVNQSHFPIFGTEITTKTMSANGQAVVSVKMNVKGVKGKTVRIENDILYGDEVVSTIAKSYAFRTEEAITYEHKIKNVKAWKPNAPHLYTVRCRMVIDGEITDYITERIGIRQVSYSLEEGFMLNNEPIKFKGVCLHHDLGMTGAAFHKGVMRYRMALLKDMGCNAIRTYHIPATQMVELCDEMGFMLVIDAFDEWYTPKNQNGFNKFFSQWSEWELVSMIQHLKNHPSIVMWNIGNAVGEECTEHANKTVAQLTAICHREDATRPVSIGIGNLDCFLQNHYAMGADIIGLNYNPTRGKAVYQQIERPLLWLQTSSTVSTRGEYNLLLRTGQVARRPNLQCPSYDAEYLEGGNVPDKDFAAQEESYAMGQFVDAGFDYLGAPLPYAVDGWPSHSSYCGIIDLACIPKDRYYLYRSMWNKRSHTLHIAPHWNWKRGDKVPVVVYTDYPMAELYVNGRSAGRRSKLSAQDARWGGMSELKRYRLIWEGVDFEPGELKVVAFDEKNPDAGTKTAYVYTAGEPNNIKLVAMNKRENCRPGDIIYVEVRVVDKDGNICPMANNALHIEVSGACKMLGAANGDPTCLNTFNSKDQNAFHGRMTIVLSVEKEGEVRIAVNGGNKLNETRLSFISSIKPIED